MKKIKVIFCFLFLFSFFIVGENLLKNNNVLNYLIFGKQESNSMNKNTIMLRKISNSITKIDSNNVVTLLNYDGDKYYDYSITKPVVQKEEDKSPLLYIYNTHDTEEYSNVGFENYNIDIKVKIASYMLQEELLKYGITSIVEEKGVISEVKKQNLEYKYSYTISNEYALEIKEKYPSIEYFIDVHRDGISKKLSTTMIEDKSYAKMMFLLGTNHENSNYNLGNVKELENYLNEKYPSLMRSTYIRSEYSYYQDISPKAFIVEIGGQDNTFYEVYNSVCLLAEALANQIGGVNE